MYAPMNKDEKATLIILLLTIAVWLGGPGVGKLLGIDIPNSLGALPSCSFFFPPGIAY